MKKNKYAIFSTDDVYYVYGNSLEEAYKEFMENYMSVVQVEEFKEGDIVYPTYSGFDNFDSDFKKNIEGKISYIYDGGVMSVEWYNSKTKKEIYCSNRGYHDWELTHDKKRFLEDFKERYDN